MFKVLIDTPCSFFDLYLESEVVDTSKINLKAEYAKFNKKLFNNELPDIPLKWGRMKTASGLTTAKVKKQGRTLISVEDINIKLSSSLKLTKEEFEKILIHEMIHVYFLNKKLNVGHGPEFKLKASELSKKAGFSIPLVHEIQNSKVSSDVAPKDHSFIYILKPKSAPSLALYNVSKAKELVGAVDRLLKVMPSGTILAVGKVRTPLGSKYPVFRSTRAIKTVTIAGDESKEILDTAEVLRSEIKE